MLESVDSCRHAGSFLVGPRRPESLGAYDLALRASAEVEDAFLKADFQLRDRALSLARKSLAMDLEVSSATGKSSQYLSSWSYIQHGNVVIYGPARVDASSSTSNVMLGMRGGWIWTIVDIEWMGGFNILDSEIKLESGNQSPSERLLSAGPYFGWKFTLKPNETAKLYGKGIASTDFSSSR